MGRHKLAPEKKKQLPLIARVPSGRPEPVPLAEPNHAHGVRYRAAQRKAMFALFARSGGNHAYVAKRTGAHINTIYNLSKKFKWDARLERINTVAEEMSDSALARELSLAQRQEIERMDLVETNILKLMSSPTAAAYVKYDQLARLLLAVSDRRLKLRRTEPLKQAPAAKSNKLDEVTSPQDGIETAKLTLEVKRRMRAVAKQAKELGLRVDDLDGMDTTKALDVPKSDYEISEEAQ